MDTRNLLEARRHARGATRTTVVAIVFVFLMLAVMAWFLIILPHEEIVNADAGGHPSTPVASSSAAAVAAPAPVDVSAMDVDQLLGEARKAITLQRYLAPAGNNAFEFYLRVLQKDPGNRVASDALRETFPFAANLAEQAISSRDFNDAQRQIDLLAKADPANYTLTILRSKLDAQRKLQDQQQSEQQKAQEAAAAKAAADKLAADQLAVQQKAAALAEQEKAKQSRAAEPTKQAAAGSKADGTGAAGTTAVESAAQNSPAALLKGADPVYPREAIRSRTSGWVIVSFTIDPNGRTSNVQVVEAQPRRVFDRAAIEAVSRYRFTPAMRDGVAVSTTRQQKIEFNL